MKLPIEIHHKIYDILEEYAGAEPWHRDDFIQYFISDLTKNPDEYYCCSGKLGYGGKFSNKNGTIYISCFPGDETDERYAIIEFVNKKLDDLLLNYLTNVKSNNIA